ncbi:MAG: hypothetical protein K9K65_11660 [Desulfarculaceae bacterium]|nr:hypothetical protein [Desulfarculaceae bacterium]MCF8098490.1 hypothetical protein [Desulfarculaceae bacterium]MCF8122311.1 hypothetical protein [Desulfarculaceae bacterium]
MAIYRMVADQVRASWAGTPPLDKAAVMQVVAALGLMPDDPATLLGKLDLIHQTRASMEPKAKGQDD